MDPRLAQCLGEERGLLEEVAEGDAAAAAVLASESQVLDSLARGMQASRDTAAHDAETLELEAICNELQYENAMLEAEDGHSRRLIRELLDATKGVKADVTYTDPSRPPGADVQERLAYHDAAKMRELDARAPGMPSHNEVDWLHEVAAAQRAYLESLAAQSLREEAALRGVRRDGAAAAAEVASRMEAIRGQLGQRLADGEAQVAQLARMLNDGQAAAAPRLAALEREAKALGCELEGAREVLRREAANHEADVEALLKRAVSSLAPAPTSAERGGKRAAARRSRTATQAGATQLEREHLVTQERMFKTTQQQLAVDAAGREERLQALRARLASLKVKERTLTAEREQLKAPHAELVAIREGLRDAEGRMWLSGATRSAGRMAKQVRRSVSQRRRLHEAPKEPEMVFA